MSKILVIGDSCIDEWVYGKCDRLSPDGPVPIIVPIFKKENNGMAGNVYDNVKSLVENFNFNVSVDFFTNTNKVIKRRFVDKKSNQLILRVDIGDEDVERFDIKKITDTEYIATIISDYDKGFLSESDINYICENSENVFIDTKKNIGKWINSAKYIKINEKEYNESINFFDKNKCFDSLIVTLGERGCMHKNKIYSVKEVEVKDMVGAGDTFISALTVEYLRSKDIEKSIIFANKCATEVVQKKGVNIIE